MQSAAFLCPYDAVFKTLQHILAKKKGYVITTADSKEGTIKAKSENFPFKKTKNLDIKICRIGRHATGMKLMINDNENVFDNPITLDEFAEKKLLDSIQRHF